MRLGKLLDVRFYRRKVLCGKGVWIQGDFIPDDVMKLYEDGQEESQEMVEWIVDHFQLGLRGADDGLTDETRLVELSCHFFIQQYMTLIWSKHDAEKREIVGEDECVTAAGIKEGLEAEFMDNEDFQCLWPLSEQSETMAAWLEAWGVSGKQTYAWPDAPNGGSYYLTRVD